MPHSFSALATCMLIAVIPGARAQDAGPEECIACHQAAAAALESSIHFRIACDDCHTMGELAAGRRDDDIPHGASEGPATCGDCHEDAEEIYTVHGRLTVGTDADAPTCADCHGNHDIRGMDDPQSRTQRTRLGAMCNACHLDPETMHWDSSIRIDRIKLYDTSVHGRKGTDAAQIGATCADCHASVCADGARSSHVIRGAADPASTTYRTAIPDMCGRCHEQSATDYWTGIHGQRVKRGQSDAPVCTQCHGGHGILAPPEEHSSVGAALLAEATCAPCHHSATLNDRYGMPQAGRLSYIDSYHGTKRRADGVRVANCASCHSHHLILPRNDPRSSVHPENLRATCGECHPRITTTFAQTSVHGLDDDIDRGWPRLFGLMYIALIIGTIGGMLLHNGAHWYRHVKMANTGESVRRMTPNEVAQHWVLLLSFSALVITGFALQYSDSWWSNTLFGWGGGAGFVYRGLIHRVAAVAMMVWTVWHLLYLLTPRGRCFMREMFPALSDLRHMKEHALFFIGLRTEPPHFGHFSYMEKAEYWAMGWGTIVMTVTGILLWFKNEFTEAWTLPKVFLDVMLVIHYYEAWLAFLAIVVWHLYATLFSPGVYPMNPAWLNGRMPKAMFDHEHAAVATRDDDSADEPV